MGALKGLKNLFIGEDESDEIDFGQDFGTPKKSKASSANDDFFGNDDLSGFKTNTSGRPKDKVYSTPDPFDDDFTRPKTAAENVQHRSSQNNNFEEERKNMSYDQTTTLQIVLARPIDFSEVRSIGDDINAFKTVILNLEMVKSDDAKRILDFLSGVAYANKAQIKMMAQKTFAIMSKNVKFDGKDLLTELENNGYSF
ncbi:cell division protein SepF [uncultured Ruminococcus sp.]|uniref:cell division protein SepF n=1 Tax=uncultured Ruminococcus sp. TaxID=165186 RepID=UPI0025F86172|nr:cell division protein SepF [uncultured Ruminococcus sp.]